jgi:hypothetical protein
MNQPKSRITLKATLALMACYGIFIGFADARGVDSTKPVEFIFSICTLVLSYVWYYFDAAERGFRRTSAMGASIVLFTLIALPIYLARSRPKGERFKSIGAMLLFMILCLVVVVVAGVPVSLALK